MYVLLDMNGDLEQIPTNTTRSDRSTRSGLENTSDTSATDGKTKPVATVAKPVAQSSATVATVLQNQTRSGTNPSEHKAATVVTGATDRKNTTLPKTANGYALNTGFAAPEPTDTNALTQGGLDL